MSTPKKKQLLYVIMSGSMFKDRVMNLKKTWCQNIDYIIYSDHEDVSENIIKVSDRTDYHSNEEKQINMINRLTDSYDWFFLCDDDTFVNTKQLHKIIPQLDKKYSYAKLITEQINPTNDIFKLEILPKGFCYMAGGDGYLLSDYIIQSIKPFKNFNTGYSDVSVGLNLYKNKVEIKDISVFRENYDIGYHRVKTFEHMNELHRLVNQF